MKFQGVIAIGLGCWLAAETLVASEVRLGVEPAHPHVPEEHQLPFRWVQEYAPIMGSGTYMATAPTAVWPIVLPVSIP
jgi:hypothetical protein